MLMNSIFLFGQRLLWNLFASSESLADVVEPIRLKTTFKSDGESELALGLVCQPFPARFSPHLSCSFAMAKGELWHSIKFNGYAFRIDFDSVMDLEMLGNFKTLSVSS